ncbi:aminodeoxychorismate synthase component I [Marinospirillum sp. MEB164]|uniref:aminodeoxychorismate synthase n=1 Tax=Marinospirillum alkalitolerans TaxID=3123374 RepID=A0ABW8PVX0_9GAMM
MSFAPLPYLDSRALLRLIQHQPWPVLLDSGHPSARAGRFSIASAAPSRRLVIQQPQQAAALDQLRPTLPDGEVAADIAHLPFISGWIGYWSYAAGQLFEPVTQQAEDDLGLPWIAMGYYPWALVTDHQRHESWLVGNAPAWIRQRLANEPAAPALHAFQLTEPFRSNMSQDAYREKFAQVQAWLRSGDVYQINLAQRFSAGFQGDPLTAWSLLREQIAAPFAAYLDFGDHQLLSLSPERFLCVDAQGWVETKPIKGTRPRGATPNEDQRLAEELLNHPKDRAENLMIVDLLRNDLGRVCRPGSIRVPDLFTLESYTNVHHLVSRVVGKLTSQASGVDLLAASFPGGSITGAPKIRAMEIIDQLEPQQRSVYCGSIGYLDDRGQMDFNIAIRTFIARQQRLYVWGGGGLVADSDPEAEYQETLDKIAQLIRCLQPDFLRD